MTLGQCAAIKSKCCACIAAHRQTLMKLEDGASGGIILCRWDWFPMLALCQLQSFKTSMIAVIAYLLGGSSHLVSGL